MYSVTGVTELSMNFRRSATALYSQQIDGAYLFMRRLVWPRQNLAAQVTL